MTDADLLRNMLVHGYTEVDLGTVCDVLVNRLGDLESFIDAIRRRLLAVDTEGSPFLGHGEDRSFTRCLSLVHRFHPDGLCLRPHPLGAGRLPALEPKGAEGGCLTGPSAGGG